MKTNFPVKLFDLVSSQKYSDMIYWSDGGTTFTILDAADFEKICLPKVSKKSSYKTFVRQLNLYG